MEVNLILYNLETCPECRSIREKMGELELTYVCANVNPVREKRHKVFAASGQYSVPVLVDGTTMLTSTDNILEYLLEKYSDHAVKPVKY
ncbi:MAG: glutathione S-transferase N-terminal domain-containing protein [Negativicutes bacterium]|nr:glutathione S-transferase N-terminal domain-containing protein [Negativicutes bacterium]